MLDGINSIIYNDIKDNLRQYFDDSRNIELIIANLLDLPNDKFVERQKISEQLIKKQLFYHGKQEVFTVIVELSRIEQVVMKLEPELRDHIVHAMLTFLLGIYLNQKLTINHYNNFVFQWKFCAPLHDIAYPVESFEKLSKTWIHKVIDAKKSIQDQGAKDKKGCIPHFEKIKIGGDYSYNIVKKFNNLQNDLDAFTYIKNQFKKWDINIDPEDYVEWLHQNNIPDHGVIGSIVLLNLFDFIYQAHNPERKRECTPFDNHDFNQEYFERDLVASTSAIFIHNVKKEYIKEKKVKIDYNTAPLAYVLCLSDRLQEWDRYSVSRPVFPSSKFEISVNKDVKRITCKMDIGDQRKNEILEEINTLLCGLDLTIN